MKIVKNYIVKNKKYILYNKDNLKILKKLEDNVIDAIVTDPPYGISFMNNKWDYNVPSVELWEECFRVLKPGGHILVACGTRTQHRMAVNIEDAGFEIRDIIAWVYGSGFPKSYNISKGIDKKFGTYKKGKISPNARFNSKGDDKHYNHAKIITIDEPQHELAKRWEGWGTALKPAMELWTLARKPLSEKNIVDNILKWNTGGINIDACRIETKAKKWSIPKGGIFKKSVDNGAVLVENTKGRFPANLIHDGSEEVISQFPYTKSGVMTKEHNRHTDRSPNGIYGKFDVNHPLSDTYGDEGSASRFFYCAKVSKQERQKGLNNHPTVKPIKLMLYLVRLITPKNGVVLDPFMGSGTTGVACLQQGFRFIGIEKEEHYCRIAIQRLKNCKTLF